MKENRSSGGKENLRAYEGVEDLTTFTSKKTIEEYREERKRFASGAISFLRKRITGQEQVSVLDIGSGSSCFLYALQDEGILSYGTGIEISKTRYDFAQQWKQDGQYLSVENINRDIRDVAIESMKFDICTILDSTFTFFYSVDSNLPDQVLQKVYKGLNNGGKLILDMSSFLDAKRLCKDSGIYYKWENLPETNKFRYSLYKVNCSLQEGIACTESRYIYRDKLGEARKTEYSKIYTSIELEKMVLGVGFQNLFFYSDYKDTQHNPETSSRIVLICQK